MKTIYRILVFPLAAALCVAAAVSCKQTELFYAIGAASVTAGAGGTATASPTLAEPGETVTLTATPDEGYVFAGWTVAGGHTAEELGLSGELENPATLTMPAGGVAVSARFEPARPTDGARWHEGTGTWIVPQADPYALDNVRTAAANLAARGTRTDPIVATHRALRIFPRNPEEQWEVEMMEDIMLLYIPFDRLALTEAQAAAGQESGELGDPRNTLFDEPGAHDCPERGDVTMLGDPTENSTLPDGLSDQEQGWPEGLPVLYAVWPVDKALPYELDYAIDYEVWLPVAAVQQTRGAAAMNAETARAVEAEAIRLALGDAAAAAADTRAGGAARTRAGVTLSGEFWVWEALRTVEGPVPNVKVKFHLGSNIVETTADEEGRFSITADAIPAASSWDIVFQTPEFKVTRNTSTVPKFFVQGGVYQSNWWSATQTHIRTTIQTYDAAIIKALGHYYYDETHNMARWKVEGGIRVVAHNSGSGSYNGLFTYSSLGTCFITIYRNNTTDVNRLMGTVFHELGHFTHFRERGGYASMKVVDRFLAESFASYAGWYLTEDYYRKLGYEKTSPGLDISGQARQTSWRSTTSGTWGYYSPLFVDLVDDFNQSTYGSTYNDDKGKGTHYSTIMRIVKESSDWVSCKAILRERNDLVGQPLDDFLDPYEYWQSNR